MRLGRALLLILLALALSACALTELADIPSTPTPQVSPAVTPPRPTFAPAQPTTAVTIAPAPPTARPTSAPTVAPTVAPTRAQPAPTATPSAAMTPPAAPTAAAISPANAKQLVEFGRYGYGAAYESVWAPDGKQIAIASTLGIFLYEPDLSTMTASVEVTSTTPYPLNGPITALAFLPDSHTVAAGLDDGTVQVWDINGGQNLFQVKGFASAVQGVVFAPDGKAMIAGSTDKTGAIRRWQLSDGKVLAPFDQAAGVLRLALSADGRQLATATTDRLQLWDVASAKLVDSFALTGDPVESLALFPPGSLSTLSAQAKAAITVWNPSGGPTVVALRGPGPLLSTAATEHAALSRDGKTLAVGSYEQGIRLYDAATGSQIGQTAESFGVVQAMRFSPAGDFLSATVANGLLLEWGTATGKLAHGLLRHTQFNTVAITPDDIELAAGGTDGALHRWDVPSGDELDELTAHDEPVQSIAYSPEGRFLASGSLDGKVLLWNLQTDQVERTILAGGPVRCIVFLPGGTRIVAGTLDGLVTQWVVDTGAVVRKFATGLPRLFQVAFSPEGRLLAADGVALTVWQTDTGQPLPGFQPVVNGAHSFAFAPDAKSVAVASPRLLNGDDAVHLVDLTTGRELRKFTVSAALVNSLAFSPDGRLLAAGAVDGITIWDVATGQTLINPKGHLGAVMSVVFTVDGTLLASASADGTIRLWGVP